jgi:hypothetical protein
MTSSCASSAGKDPRRDNVLAGMALLLADNSTHETDERAVTAPIANRKLASAS